ncbi:MAG: nicotinate (nicotinamide) nucleotide adenylyltransferase [Spirochaetales bacterium]
MKLAMLGGSFNPVHIGHLMLVQTALEQFNFDKIIFVPAYNPPHKELASGASAEDRLCMLQKAVAGNPRYDIEDCELKRQGSSYTIETVLFLEKKYKQSLESKIGLIIGNDLVKDFHLWKDVDNLAQKTDIITANRDCKNADEILQYPHRTMHNDFLAVSSQMIRHKIACAEDWKHLVPYDVYCYITDRNLYACT